MAIFVTTIRFPIIGIDVWRCGCHPTISIIIYTAVSYKSFSKLHRRTTAIWIYANGITPYFNIKTVISSSFCNRQYTTIIRRYCYIIRNGLFLSACCTSRSIKIITNILSIRDGSKVMVKVLILKSS